MMILVTGATGYVGRHVVQALTKSGLEVRCLVRNLKECKLSGVELVQGDVADPVSLAVATTGVETVVHLVAIIREKKNLTYADINVNGTQNVVAAAQKNGVKHFIQMSALGAGLNPKYQYIYSKGLADISVINSGISYTILRPSIMFGPGGVGFVDRLLQLLRMTPTVVALPGNGTAKFQPISVKDVAACVLQIVTNPERFKNQIIEIGGPEHLAFEEMLDVLMEVTEIRKAKLPIPMPMVRLAAGLMQVLMKDPPVIKAELAQLDIDNVTDLDAVKKHFGFAPTRFAEGIEYIKHQLANEQKHKSK